MSAVDAREELIAAVERRARVELAEHADHRERAGGAAVPSMLVSLSMRSVAEPVASVIVTLPEALAGGERAARDRHVVDAHQPSLERLTGAAVGELRERDDLRRGGGIVPGASSVALVTDDLGEAVELRDRADGFDAVADRERPGVERAAEDVDAAGRVLDVVLDAVAAAEINRGHGAAHLHDLIEQVGNEVAARRAVGVDDGVDPRLGDGDAAREPAGTPPRSTRPRGVTL